MSFGVAILPLLSLTFMGVASQQSLTSSSATTLTAAISPYISNLSVVPVVPAVVNSLSIVNIPVVPSIVYSINISRPTPITPASTLTTGRCRSLDLLSATPCMLSDCGRFRSIECNEATDRDLVTVFATYDTTFGQSTKNQSANQSTSGPRSSAQPLTIRLNGGAINRTSGLFGPLAEQVVKLELNQVALPSLLPDMAFADLKNLVTLSFNGVVTDTISRGAFRNLTSLQSLSIDNLPVLRMIQPSALEPTLFPALKCLKVNISSTRFLCDCDTNTWLQKSLINNTMLMNRTNWNDVYTSADSNSSTMACGVNIVCSANSNEPFRRNMADINLAAVCTIPTTSTDTTTSTTATTAATTAAPRTSALVQQNVPSGTTALPRTAANGSPKDEPLFWGYPVLLVAITLLIKS